MKTQSIEVPVNVVMAISDDSAQRCLRLLEMYLNDHLNLTINHYYQKTDTGIVRMLELVPDGGNGENAERMNDDTISRQAAIGIIQSMYPGIPRVSFMRKDWQERYAPFIRVENAIRELPSAQPIDVQEAYYRGKIDGVKECTARLKKVNEEVANG